MAAVTFSKLVQINRVRECTAYLGDTITHDTPHLRIAETIPGSKEYEVINRWINAKGGYKSETLSRARPLRETKAMAARMLTCGALLGLGDRAMEWAEGADRNQIRDHIENGTPLPGTPEPDDDGRDLATDDPIVPDPPVVTDAARYHGEYYRAGQMPTIPGGALARVHRSPYRAGLFAMIFAYGARPLALIGPYAEVQDMADNLAASGIKLVKGTNGQWFYKADPERGKAMEQHDPRKVYDIGRAATVRGTRKGTLRAVK